MTRTRGVVKAARLPVASPRKPVPKEYGANAEYAMTAYERRRLERKDFLPPRLEPSGDVPGAADRDATPSQDSPAPPAGESTSS